MEFKQAMRIFNRICKDREKCDGCVLENKCIVQKECDYSTAEAILAKWAAQHPERTIADDFFEKHPNAPGKQDKQPLPCAVHCGYIDKCPDDFTALECKKCWQRQLKEE